MKIFLDLDGTLLDSRERLYQLFQQLVPVSRLSFDAYWAMKRNKIGHAVILKSHFDYSDDDIDAFLKIWMGKIESPELLLLDTPFDDTTACLNTWKQKHDLYLVTARQSKDSVATQIVQHGWTGIFTKVLVTEQQQEKHELIERATEIDEADWFVGDTGKDIQTGKLLGMRTAAVLSGFLSREKLQAYKPDRIVERLSELEFDK